MAFEDAKNITKLGKRSPLEEKRGTETSIAQINPSNISQHGAELIPRPDLEAMEPAKRATVEQALAKIEEVRKRKALLLEALARIEESEPEYIEGEVVPETPPATQTEESRGALKSVAELEAELRNKKEELSKPGFLKIRKFIRDEITSLETELVYARERERRAEELRLSNLSTEKRAEERRKLEEGVKKAKTEALRIDREKNPFKYYILDKIPEVVARVIFRKFKPELTKEDITNMMGESGEEVNIHHLENIEKLRENAVSISSNGFSLRLINKETVTAVTTPPGSVSGRLDEPSEDRYGTVLRASEVGKETVNRQDPRARYELYDPQGKKIIFSKYPEGLDFGIGHRELKTQSEDYQRTMLEAFRSKQ